MLEQKFDKLQSMLETMLEEGLLIAYSGGVDSSFLLWTALEVSKKSKHEKKLVALLADSASLARDEREFAIWFAKQIQAPLEVVLSSEIEKEEYARNDLNRCYHCKSELFTIGAQEIKNHALKYIAYGYNASDAAEHRPGHKAAIEFEVRSPLAEAGLTKSEIRELISLKMPECGKKLKDKPASPCLSSRLMTGVRVTSEKLSQIDTLEAYLRKNGLKVFRLRLHEYKNESGAQVRFLRLEVDPSEMINALMLRGELNQLATGFGFHWLTLDMAGYKTGGANVFENAVSR